MAERTRVQSGSSFETQIGFCRALRVGNRVLVSGTAPIWPDDHVDPDASVQAERCFDIIGEALDRLGATFGDAVRTRMYLVDAEDASAVGGVHAHLFGSSQPVATMVVVSGFLDPRWKVEIELEAEID